MTVLSAAGQLERDQIAERTREGLAAAKAKGQRLGGLISAEPIAAGVRALELRAEGPTWRDVAEALNAEDFARARSGSGGWHASAAHRTARSLRLTREAEERRGERD